MDSESEFTEENNPKLRKINREIASVVVISKDGKFLLGKKHLDMGSSYEDFWHLIGGGVDESNGVRETLLQTAIREAREEAGLILKENQLKPINNIGYGESEKTLQSGERVIAKMTFNRFEVRLPQNASDVELPSQTEEFAQLRWFTPAKLSEIEQIPGGKDFFVRQGYIPNS
jgi:8-oxo-dGTP pyrophosphatase MutT (NUDIX family)